MKPSPAGLPGPLPGEPGAHRHRPAWCTTSASSRTTGRARRSGAWGLGWEVWCDGMEVTQFTYFQQVGGFDCNPVSGEITYGLERLAMYVQGVDRVFDLNFNGRTDARKLTYGDVFLQAEQEYSRFNFEHADTEHPAAALPRRREGMQGAAGGRRAGAGGQRQAPQAGAAGLRPVHQGLPHLQPARCARRDLRHRAAELHPARARARQGLLRGVAANRGGRGVSIPKTLLEMSGADLTPLALAQSVVIVIDAQNEYLDGKLALPGVKPAVVAIAKLLAKVRASGTPACARGAQARRRVGPVHRGFLRSFRKVGHRGRWCATRRAQGSRGRQASHAMARVPGLPGAALLES